MTRLNVNPYEFDSRTIEWNLKSNRITKDQLANYIKNLPDESSNSEHLNFYEDSTERETR